MTGNTYFEIASDDLLFAKAGLTSCKQMRNYNNVTSLCAQAAEKFLKQVIEVRFEEDEDVMSLLHTHNLRTLVNKILENFPDCGLNQRDCKWVGDFYFDARYPGDNFINSEEKDAKEAIRIVEEIKEITATLAKKEQITEKKTLGTAGTLDDMKKF